MYRSKIKSFSRFLVSLILTTASWNAIAKSSSAQVTCQPPKTGEYLLLIVSRTSEEQQLVRRTLPSDVKSEVCRYVDNTVTRIGGFEDQLIAEDWAAYLQDKMKLPAYVVKPETIAVRPTPTNTNSVIQRPPSTTTPPQTTAYNPRPLGSGYAVLVDFYNKPELATQLETLVGEKVGLVSYGQRPYLLVEYTADADVATATLKSLSGRGYSSILVDSSRVTVISPTVNP